MDRESEFKKIRLIEFGDMVRALRFKKGLSSNALSKKAKLNLKTVLRVENGLCDTLRVGTIIKLAEVLKFEPLDYMDLTKK